MSNIYQVIKCECGELTSKRSRQKTRKCPTCGKKIETTPIKSFQKAIDAVNYIRMIKERNKLASSRSNETVSRFKIGQR